MNEIIEERRQRKRVLFETKVNIRTADGSKFCNATSRNIGMGGIYLETGDLLDPETGCEVEIILTAKHSHIILHIKGEVTRTDGNGLAIRFENDLEWWALFAIYGQYGNPSAKLFTA